MRMQAEACGSPLARTAIRLHITIKFRHSRPIAGGRRSKIYLIVSRLPRESAVKIPSPFQLDQR
jgi:hypothetical protein